MPASHETAVVLGRFQPFHAGHLHMLQQALALAPRCIVVIGSAYQARTPRHPWHWHERAEMIRLALPGEARARLDFLPLRDYHDDARWIVALRRGLAALLPSPPANDLLLLGDFGGSAEAVVRDVAGWRVLPAQHRGQAEAAALRDALFGGSPLALDATLAALAHHAPVSTLAAMRALALQPDWSRLSDDWHALARYHAAWAHTPFPSVFVTVDALVRCAGHVLLIRRGQPPGAGLLALPGGFVDVNEALYQSALRELREETGLALPAARMRASLRAVTVFDRPERGQRGRAITHVHCFVLDGAELPPVRAADDAQAAQWVPIDRLASLEDQFHDDHFQMLDHFLGTTSV